MDDYYTLEWPDFVSKYDNYSVGSFLAERGVSNGLIDLTRLLLGTGDYMAMGMTLM